MKFKTLFGDREGTLEVSGDGFVLVTERTPAEAGATFSIEPLDDGCYSVLIQGRSYRVSRSTLGELQVNGRTIPVEVFDPRALRARSRGQGAQGRQNVAASMPGKVIRILVAQGDSVEAGQGLVVVEAMKMQNEMKSPKAGRVAEIKTKEGAAVTAGDVLVVVE